MKAHFLLKATVGLVLGGFPGLWAWSALAAEELLYDTPIPRSSFEHIKSFSIKTLKADASRLKIAKTDLNGDGLYEFITRDKYCKSDSPCRFDVLAENHGDIYSLGTFEGQDLLLGNEFTHGVRNILVFGNATNDFDYELYTWHPETSSYRKAPQ